MRTLRLLLLFLASAACVQENDILTVYTGSEYPLYFIDTRGKVILTLPEGDRPVTFLDYMPTMEQYTGLQNFHEGVCIVRKKTGGFLWLDQNCRTTKVFDSQQYNMMFPLSQGYSVAEIRTPNADPQFVFLDTAGNEAFKGMKFTYATPFFNDSSLVQLEGKNGEWGYMNRDGQFKRINNDESSKIYYDRMGKVHTSGKRLLNKIDDELDHLLKAYDGGSSVTTDDSYKQFVLQHDYFTKEYKVVDVRTNKVIWSSPPENITFRNLDDAKAFRSKVTRIDISGDELNVFPKDIYEFKNLTHLTLQSNDVLTEIPAGISSLKNLRSLTLGYLGNLKSLPDDIHMLENLEVIEVLRSGYKLKNFEAFVEKAHSLKTVNTLNYDFPKDLFKRLIEEKPKLQLNIEYE